MVPVDLLKDVRESYPAFTKGWFQVAWSTELSVSDVRRLKYFGQELVLFRGEDGVARLMNAHCPHLGAHLGVGGKVEGNCISCPFHGWKFDGEGKCTSIPYSKTVPSKAKLVTWPILERDGMIFTWYAGPTNIQERAKEQPFQPDYEIPRIVNHDPREWSGWVTHTLDVRAHSLDILENSIDSAHFVQCHKFADAKLEVFMNEGTLEVKQHIKAKILGKTIHSGAHYHMIAPGFHYIYLDSIKFLPCLLVCSLTPIDLEHVSFRMSFAFKQKWPKFLDSLVLFILKYTLVRKMLSAIVNDDLPIWKHKQFLSTPGLWEGDGPFGTIRRWYLGFARPLKENTNGTLSFLDVSK